MDSLYNIGKPGGQRAVLLALLGIVALRFAFIGLMGLMPQDAYYYFYSEHPALSYYDHPPAIAYCLKLFTTLFGKKVFVLKLADFVITTGSVFAFYTLAGRFLSRHAVQKALLLLLSTFMVTILSLISTPDTPLILCWTVSLLALYKAIFEENRWYWIWAGLAMGLAFDSKYTAVFLPVGTLLFLLLSRSHRRLLLSPWPWLALLVFAVACSPVIIWNVENDFASFRFQSSSRAASIAHEGIDPLNFLGVLGHQSAILMPILFFTLCFSLYKAIRKYGRRPAAMDAKQLFLLSFFLPVFIGFLCISVIYWVKLNWMMPAYITGIIWVSSRFNMKWIRIQLIFSLAVHLVLAIEVVFYPVSIHSDDTWVGWRELARQVQQIQKKYPGTFIFSADDYKTSAVLNFYLDEMVYSRNIIGKRALQFDYIGSDLSDLEGKNALYIDSNNDFSTDSARTNFSPEVAEHFESVKALPPIIVKRDGRTIRKFFVYICKNYKEPGETSNN
ncbi:MAG: glycosyltransferase family 39 protein [Bacteroidetes bacterium]|nr:glycosyltransferase family 39 protein [Bacteroidota bacterium]